MPRGQSTTKSWINANRIEQVPGRGEQGPAGPPGAAEFPISFDDGTNTYEILVDGEALILRVTSNAGSDLLYELDLGSVGIGITTFADADSGDIVLDAQKSTANVTLNAGGGVLFLGDNINMGFLPTSDPGVSGQLYNLLGVLRVSP